MKQLVENFANLKPNKIYFKAHLDAPEETITVEELEKRCNFTFSEGLVIAKTRNKQLVRDLEKKSQSGKTKQKVGRNVEKKSQLNTPDEDFKDKIQQTYESFTVVNLGETIGYALFSRQPIKKGSFIGFYSGNIIYKPKNCTDDDYLLDIAEVTNLCVSSKIAGNFLRFMSDLPCTEDSFVESKRLIAGQGDKDQIVKIPNPGSKYLEDPITMRYFNISKELSLNAIATENVQSKMESYQNIQMLAFYALFDIPENTLIGWSYGNAYWNTRGKNPRLFFKDGHAVSENNYMPTYINLNYEDSHTQTIRHMSLSTEAMLGLINNHQDLEQQNLFIPFYILLQKAHEEHLLAPAAPNDAFIKQLQDLLATTVQLHAATIGIYTLNNKGNIGIKCTYQNETEKTSLMRFFSSYPITVSNKIRDDSSQHALYVPIILTNSQ